MTQRMFWYILVGIQIAVLGVDCFSKGNSKTVAICKDLVLFATFVNMLFS